MGKTAAAVVGIVAAVAIAIVAPPLGLALGAALGISTAVATALVTVGLSLAASFAFRALGIGAPSAKNAVGPPQVFRQSIANSFIVYGKRRVGGLLAFFHGKQVGSDHFRYFVIAVAGHRCQGVVSWMLGDEIVTVGGGGAVTTGKYAGAAWLWFQRGLASETANSTFVSECDGNWTTNHKGNGIAAIYAKFQMTDDVVAAGMPNITAIIEGRDEVHDTRDGVDKFSSNAALVFYDWMQIAREEGGFGAYSDEVPDDTWISAQANVCDETVSSEHRYELHGVIQTGAPPNEVRDAMIVNCAGTYTYSGGKHVMRPGYWVAVTENLSEDDVAGQIQVSPFLPSDAAANEVQGTFINPADNYQGAPFTTQTLSSPPTDVRQIDLDLAFTVSLHQADRVARIMLNRAQAEKSVVWPMNVAGIKVQALDTVQLDTARYGLSNYAWSVANWALSADWGVVLSLREENEEIYDAPSVSSPTAPPPVSGGTPVVTGDEVQTVLRGTYARGLAAAGIDAGTTASITLSTFVLDYPNSTGDVSMPSGSVTGLAFTTAYYLYADLDSIGDTTPTYGATTTYGDALNSATHPWRVYLGQKVTTPADGGTSTGGTGSGGGYGSGDNNIP